MIQDEGFKFSELDSQSDEDSRRFLREAIRKNRPVILSCRADFKYYPRDSHFIILKGIDKKYIYINDPYPDKPHKINIESFTKNQRPKKRETKWGRSRWALAIFR